MKISVHDMWQFGYNLSASVPLFESKVKTYCADTGEFKEHYLFCGRPHLDLCVYQKDNIINATMTLRDQDDYELDEDYNDITPDFVHELLNWMRDHEYTDVHSMKSYRDLLY